MGDKATVEILKHFLCNTGDNPSISIGKSNLGGRGVFATKRINKGSLIFVNNPLAIGPRSDCDNKKFCSNCYQISALCYSCEKCFAFVCSKSCVSSVTHVSLCIFVQNNWKLKSQPDSIEEISITLNQVHLYLQFLMLSEKQKSLLSMFQKKHSDSSYVELEILLSKFVIPEQQIDFMKTVIALIKINSFRISDCPREKKIPLRGLYPLSSFMNHNCVPNTRNVFSKDYTMAVYATKDIEIGEEISSCYTGLLWCSPARRCQLYKSKHFWCHCKRCTDATEMDTKLSAINCLQKDCQGNLLPREPLNPQTNWLCDSCKGLVSPERINIIQSVLGSLVGTLKLDNEFHMENMVLKRLAIFVPYSNHIFVDIQLRLAIRLGFEDGIINGIT